MKSPTIHRRIKLILLFVFLLNNTFSQINVSFGPEVTPEEMVECIIGEGIVYENVTYQGFEYACGIFSNGDSLGFDNGVILTTGHANVIPGPNNSFNSGLNNGMGGNLWLNNISLSGTTYDASVLEFDFYPESDTLKIKYVFGSEEYNEWVNSSFNDVFGISISGPNPMGGDYYNELLTVLSDSSITQVSINNVNNGYAPYWLIPTGPCENCEYYRDNTNGIYLQYDGLTEVLTAIISVVPCEQYHIRFGVADENDHEYDSGLFIEENSIACPVVEVETILDPPGLVPNMVEGNVNAELTFKLPNSGYSPITVNLDLSESTANPAGYPVGDFEEEVPDEIYFPEGQNMVSIDVDPVHDWIIEGNEHLNMVIENTLGCITRYDSLFFLIEDYLQMNTETVNDQYICLGQEVYLHVSIENGYPPYSYFWQPGGFTTDSILVSPEETTIYTVSSTDLFQADTVIDSVLVNVFTCDPDFLSFNFELGNNPFLPWDVIGQVGGDSINLEVPVGTDIENLVATFNSPFGTTVYIDTVQQFSGISQNDYTNPITYTIVVMNGNTKDWTVVVDVVTAKKEFLKNEVIIFPNPATDKIHFRNAIGFEVSLVNSYGEVIKEKKIITKNYFLEIHDLETGIYYLYFVTDEYVFVEKVVISQP